MHANHKTDETILRNIIRRYTRPVSDNNRLKLIIYYKNRKTSSLVMRNSPYNDSLLQSTNVVYKFKCNTEGGALLDNCYIGMTTTSISRRITMHLQNGSIKDHYINSHPLIPRENRRNLIVDNFSILARCNSNKSLEITEAMYIKDFQPNLNIQNIRLGGVLKLFPPLVN